MRHMADTGSERCSCLESPTTTASPSVDLIVVAVVVAVVVLSLCEFSAAANCDDDNDALRNCCLSAYTNTDHLVISLNSTDTVFIVASSR